MNIIKKSVPMISMLIGNQNRNSNSKYRLFSAVTIVEYKEVTLFYNSATKELIALNKEESMFLSKYNLTENEIPSYLVQNYFFVPVDFDDKKFLDQVRPILASIQRVDTNFYEIFTTTACNARCFYCFEAGIIHKDMDNKTAEAVANYIVSQSNGRKVKIEWFGGEPLCNYAAIDIITNCLTQNNIEFSSQMITNGSLFTKELVQKSVKNWHLKRLQITLDGTEEVYNRCKNYIDFVNESPFTKVIENIELLLANNIKIIIRLNFDFHNADNLYELVDFLKLKFCNEENLYIYAYPLYENCGYKEKHRTKNERMELIDKLIDFEKYCIDIGINCVRDLSNKLNLTGCMPSNENSSVISIDGEFFKCPHVLDEKPFGGINTTETDYDIISSWKEKANENDFCSKCFNYIDCFRMKKCPHDMPCDESYRKLQHFKLENRIKKTYDSYLKENLKKIDDDSLS